MKVFIVTKGSYSDYHIVSVYLDKDLAQELADQYAADVEEWEIGQAVPKMYRWRVYLDQDGNLQDQYTQETTLLEGEEAVARRIGEAPGVWWSKLFVALGATKEEAIKNAKDFRASWIAANDRPA